MGEKEKSLNISESKKIIMPLSMIIMFASFVFSIGYYWAFHKQLPSDVKTLQDNQAKIMSILKSHCTVIKAESRRFILVCDKDTGAFSDIQFKTYVPRTHTEQKALLKLKEEK